MSPQTSADPAYLISRLVASPIPKDENKAVPKIMCRIPKRLAIACYTTLHVPDSAIDGALAIGTSSTFAGSMSSPFNMRVSRYPGTLAVGRTEDLSMVLS